MIYDMDMYILWLPHHKAQDARGNVFFFFFLGGYLALADALEYPRGTMPDAQKAARLLHFCYTMHEKQEKNIKSKQTFGKTVFNYSQKFSFWNS